MARSVRAKIEAKSHRLKLPADGVAHWRVLEPGLSIAYVRPRNGGAGTWKARVMTSPAGERPVKFRQAVLGPADDFRDADGERYLSWMQAQTAAQAWARRQAGGGALTVAKAIERYLADLTARKGDRAAGYARQRLAKHVPSRLAAKLVGKLTTGELRAWHVGMVRGEDEGEERQRQSRDSANRTLATLRAALNLSFGDGFVSDDRPWRRLKPFRAVGSARMVLLSPDDVQRLVDACGPGLRELVAAGTLTGCRLGELTSAEVRDLDMKAATLRVSGKTGSRQLHLGGDALALCRKMASGRKPTDRLFVTVEGGEWIESAHKRPFKAAVEKAGVDPAATYYALRHFFISNALKAGVPAKALADHCGTSLLMIEQNYAKFAPEDRARYAELAAPRLRIGEDGVGKVVSMRRLPKAG